MFKRKDKDSWYSYRAILYRRARIALKIGITILILLLSMVAFVSYIYQYSGTFVISSSNNEKGFISLCTNKEFYSPTTFLTAEPKNVWPVEYLDLDIEKVKNTDGISKEGNYFGYTFYLRNMGEVTVDVEVSVLQDGSVKNLGSCSRIMLIQENRVIGIFKLKDGFIDWQDKTPQNWLKEYTDKDIYKYTIERIKPEEIIRFSVLIWIDGWDIDCTDDKKSGAVQYGINIDIIDSYEEN